MRESTFKTMVRSRRKLCIIACAILAGATATAGRGAAADASGETTAFDACLKAARATTADIRCEVAEVERQTAMMQSAYRARLSGLTGREREALASDQSVWTSDTEARCGALARRPGPWSSAKAQSCRIDALVERRRALADRTRVTGSR